MTTETRELYDRCSPGFVEVFGHHQHDGYRVTGDESREEAQEKLVQVLADRIGLAPGARVLDVGCGVGGTAEVLARRRGCVVTEGALVAPLAESFGMPEVHSANDLVRWLDELGWRDVVATDETEHISPGWGLAPSDVTRVAFWRLVRRLGPRVFSIVRGARRSPARSRRARCATR